MKSKARRVFESIYLGDRAIKGIEIDSETQEIRIKIDVISKLEKGSSTWNYYTDEDIENGFLVFKEVESFKISPPGAIPDDLVIGFELNDTYDKLSFNLLTTTSVGKFAGHEVNVEILCKGFELLK